jgi:hypothetical protein
MHQGFAPQTKPKRRRWLLRLCVAALLLISAIVLLCVLTGSDDNNTVWYTESEFAKAVKPGALTKFKNTVSNWRWVKPVLNRFQKPDTQIHFRTDLVNLQSERADNLALGIPISTNSGGIHLWVLSSEQHEQLAYKIKFLHFITNAAQSIITADGMAFEATANELILQPVADKSFMPRLVVDCLPKTFHDAIRLTLCANTASISNAPTGSVPNKTGFVVACQALIPDGGAAVLDVHRASQTNDSAAFLIITPTLVNPDGSRLFDPTDMSKRPR